MGRGVDDAKIHAAKIPSCDCNVVVSLMTSAGWCFGFVEAISKRKFYILIHFESVRNDSLSNYYVTDLLN